MARCNLLLSRTSDPAADVLVIGSSRSGVALDPVAMEQILTRELARPVRVDRLSFGDNPLRAMSGLLENYLEARGAPRTVVLELMFMTDRSVRRLARRGLALAPEDYLYRRDVNLLDFGQLLSQPSAAMPFTTRESMLNLWSQRLRGVILRSGALIYQSLREPTLEWELTSCARADWVRDAVWPPGFAFSYGDFEPDADVAVLIDSLRADIARKAEAGRPEEWQSDIPEDTVYPYDFESEYRQGEVIVLQAMIERALDHGMEVVLLPLPLFGYELDHSELHDFVSRFARKVHVFDLYGDLRVNVEPLWYDDAHVERSSVGRLTTALMARRLLRSPALQPPSPGPDG